MFETLEEFYNARWRQSYNEGMDELIMDPSMQPERRLCQCDTVGKIEQLGATYKPQENVFKDIEEKVADMVNHPPHYNDRTIEVIDIIEICIEPEENPKVAYNMSNVLKYILRFRGKNGVQDLMKAKWYLDRMIEKLEEE